MYCIFIGIPYAIARVGNVTNAKDITSSNSIICMQGDFISTSISVTSTVQSITTLLASEHAINKTFELNQIGGSTQESPNVYMNRQLSRLVTDDRRAAIGTSLPPFPPII